MEIKVKLDQLARNIRSIYVDGRCVKTGLSAAEADALIRKLLDEAFARPRL